MKTFKCFFVAAAVVALGLANISEAQLSGLIGIGHNNHHQHSLINLNLGSSNRPQHSSHQSSSVSSGHSGWINGVNGLSSQNVNTNNIRQDSSLIGNSNSGSSEISQVSGSGIYTFGSSVTGEMVGSSSPQFQIPTTNGQSSSGANLNIVQGSSGSSTHNTYASSSQQSVSSSGSSENVHVGQQLPLSPTPNDGLSGNGQGGITENTSSLLGLNINVGQILGNTVAGVAGILGGSSSSSSVVSQEGQSSASGIAQISSTVQPSITTTQNQGQSMAGNSSPQSPSVNAGNPGRQNYYQGYYYIVNGTKYYVSKNGATVVAQGGLGSSPGNGVQSGVTEVQQGGQGSPLGNGPISSTVQPSIVPTQNAGQYISSGISNQNSITETSKNVTSSAQTVSSVVGINIANSGSPQENAPNGVESNPSRPNVNGGIDGNSSPQSPSVNAANPGRPQESGKNYYQGYYIVDGIKYYVSKNGAIVVAQGGPSGNGPISSAVQPSTVPTQNAGQYISSDVSNPNSISYSSASTTGSLGSSGSVPVLGGNGQGSVSGSGSSLSQSERQNSVNENTSLLDVNLGLNVGELLNNVLVEGGSSQHQSSSTNTNGLSSQYETASQTSGQTSSAITQTGSTSGSAQGGISTNTYAQQALTNTIGQSGQISGQASSVIQQIGSPSGSTQGGSSTNNNAQQAFTNTNGLSSQYETASQTAGQTSSASTQGGSYTNNYAQQAFTNANGLSSQYETASQIVGQTSSAITQSGSSSGSAHRGSSTNNNGHQASGLLGINLSIG